MAPNNPQPRQKLTRRELQQRRENFDSGLKQMRELSKAFSDLSLCVHGEIDYDKIAVVEAEMTKVLEVMREASSPRDAVDMAEALAYHAHCAKFQGHFRKAESSLRESMHQLSTVSVYSRDAQHQKVLIKSSTHLGEILGTMKRFDDAEAILRAAIAQANRTEKMGVYVELAKVLMQKGELVEAEQCILTALEALNSEEGRLTWAEEVRSQLIVFQHVRLANIYEMMGDEKRTEALKHDTLAFQALKRVEGCSWMPELADSMRRIGRQTMDYLGDAQLAVDKMGIVLGGYKGQYGQSGLNMGQRPKILRYVYALRVYAEALTKIGDVETANLILDDINETEDIFLALHQSLLDELREEMVREREGNAAQGATSDAPKKKAASRKQQKRKAAARRKREEQQQQQQQQQQEQQVEGGEDVEAAPEKQQEKDKVEELATAVAAFLKMDEKEEDVELEECSVCLGEMDLEADGGVLLVCSHLFHSACVARWQAKCEEKNVEQTCPMCRGPLVMKKAV